jgi:RNA polymerase sigma-70 factor, ECF subfamily
MHTRASTGRGGDGAVPRADVARLYALHAARVHRWVLRFEAAGNAEEVVHEIFVKVIERIDRFRAEASPTTWLYRMTTNHCLNRLRDTDRRAQLWREQADTMWTVPVVAADQETVSWLGQFWRGLDDELVEVGVYYFVDGMTHAEIARIVGCSERTVGNRIERLRRAATAAAGGEP